MKMWDAWFINYLESRRVKVEHEIKHEALLV